MTLTFSAGRQNKIHISVDGEYSMTVDADFWFTLGFSNGDEIDEEQLAELSRAVKERRAYNKALNLLSYRDHSSKELADKLRRTDGDAAARAAVERVEEIGLVNDESYARRFAAELAERKGYGSRRVSDELRRRGISGELAREISAELEQTDLLRLNALLEGRFASRLSEEKERRRTFNALVRFGYSFFDIKSAMNNYFDASEDD